MKPTQRDYCEFLVATQTNYTQIYLADYHPHFSHDAINRYLQDGNITPAIVWEQVSKYIEHDPDGLLLFDDSVSDKNSFHQIELVRRQYSGNAHALVKGIGVVNCLYVNPKSGHYWIIDWRVFDPQGDHKTRLQHVKEMFDESIAVKKLAFRVVLMDSWFATTELMMHIHRAGKLFYCPFTSNRLVDDSQVQQPCQAVNGVQWSDQATAYGKLIKMHKFPGPLKVKLFRVATGNGRTEWVVTNDLEQDSVDDTREICALRWKIEQDHRQVKPIPLHTSQSAEVRERPERN